MSKNDGNLLMNETSEMTSIYHGQVADDGEVLYLSDKSSLRQL